MRLLQIRVIIAVAALALAAACGSSQKSQQGGTGRVLVAVGSSALSARSDVAGVSMTLTNVDSKWTATSSLRNSHADGTGQWSGSFEQVPAGRYGVKAQAVNSAGEVLFATPEPYPATPAVVMAGGTTTLDVLLQEAHPAAPFANSAPYFTALVANQVNASTPVQLTAWAQDPDAGDSIQFAWSCSAGGSFSQQADTATTTSTTWTPAGNGTFTILVTGTDSKNARAAVSITISVSDAGATGGLVTIVDLNSFPTVSTVATDNAQVKAGDRMSLTAVATDADGDALTFDWSADCAGTFDAAVQGPAGTSKTTFTLTSTQTWGFCTITATASDGRGGTNTGKLSFSLSPVAIGGGPQLKVLLLTATDLEPGSQAEVKAVPAEGAASWSWKYAWSDSLQPPSRGSFAPAAGTSDGSDQLYTPAACATLGTGAHLITLSVLATDSQTGASSVHSVPLTVHCPGVITVLETSDLHANLMPWDYFSASPSASVGLAKVATLVAQERAANPCSLLVDNGDTIQGTPLGTYYALVDQTSKHPMAVAMNYLKYDAMVAGNHEFNYGMATLGRFQRDAAFPVLSANVRNKADGSQAFVPYVIKNVCGVKVGILGLVTPGITTWDAENTKDLLVDPPIDAATRFVPEMRSKGAEVIVVAFHAGPDRTPTVSGAAGWLTDVSSWVDNGSMPHENDVIELAQQVPGIDAILTGHTHLNIPKMLVGSTIMLQPYRWGSHLGVVSLGVDHASGRWTVTSRDSKLDAINASVVQDPALTALVQPYHDTTVAYVETPIGNAVAPFPGGDQARFTDSALADLINTVQMDAAAAAGFPVDVSLAAIFNNTGMIPAGPVKLRDAYSAYIYDNTLYVMEITGKTLRDALEQDAKYYVQLDPADLPATAAGTKNNIPDYNWDLYSGIDYTIDLTRPALSRVTKLKLNGVDVTDAQMIRIAVNNYRAGGGGYPALKAGTILWKSADGVRDFLAAYVTAHPDLDPNAVNTCNFTLVPDLFAKYFPGMPARCQGSPLVGSSSTPSVLSPGQNAQLRVVLTGDASGWTFTWSDSLSGPQHGNFSVTSSNGQSDATYTPASCVDLGLGNHIVNATATATNADGTQTYTAPFTFIIACAPAATGSVSVKVLAINDFHGQISAGKKVGTSAVGSAGVLAAYLKNAMAGKEASTFLVEAGDLVGASPASSALLQDEPSVSFFNLFANSKCGTMPPPALQPNGIGRFDSLFDPGCNLVGVPGNHEFDEGVDELTRLLAGGNHAKGPFLQDPWQGARFPVVSSNVRKANGELLFRPYVVKYVAPGVQVGFIGATLTSTPSIVIPAGVAGLTFEDEIGAINAQVKELQARGVHAIVVVLHDGVYQSGSYTGPTKTTQAAPADLTALVARLDADVDVLITAHTHNFANEYVKNAGGKDVLVTQAYSSGTAYADIDLTVDGITQDITTKVASVPTTYVLDLLGNPAVTPDPAAVQLTADAEAKVGPLVNAQVATSTGIISKTINAAGESTLGDLLAEAQRVSVAAEIGFTNPGGMRADVPSICTTPPCVITWNDCFTAQPFGNQVMRVTLTGQQLKDALEQQFNGWAGQTATRMLQISGFTYSWSSSAPLGSKLVAGSLKKIDGTPIDLAATYQVAMNNYLQGGGDNFSVLKGGTNVVPGPLDNDALVDYLKKLGAPVTPAIDGRVTLVP